MTVADELTKLKNNLKSAYTACDGKGATLPTKQNFDNLSATIDSITGGGGMPEALQTALLQSVGGVFGYDFVQSTSGVFEQPTKMTSNGTVGGAGFATFANDETSPYYSYRAFVNDNYWKAATLPAWIGFYNPEKLVVSSLDVTHYGSYVVTEYIVQACNDGSSWQDVYTGVNTNISSNAVFNIPVNSKVGYKYWRLYITKRSGGSYIQIKYIKINATVGADALDISKGQSVKSVEPLQMVVSPNDSSEVLIETLSQGQTTGSTNDLYTFGKNTDFISYTFRICATGTAPVLPSGFDFAVKIGEGIIL